MFAVARWVVSASTTAFQTSTCACLTMTAVYRNTCVRLLTPATTAEQKYRPPLISLDSLDWFRRQYSQTGTLFHIYSCIYFTWPAWRIISDVTTSDSDTSSSKQVDVHPMSSPADEDAHPASVSSVVQWCGVQETGSCGYCHCKRPGQRVSAGMPPPIRSYLQYPHSHLHRRPCHNKASSLVSSIAVSP